MLQPASTSQKGACTHALVVQVLPRGCFLIVCGGHWGSNSWVLCHCNKGKDSSWLAITPMAAQAADWNIPKVYKRGPLAWPGASAWRAGFSFDTQLGAIQGRKLFGTIFVLFLCITTAHHYLTESSLCTLLTPNFCGCHPGNTSKWRRSGFQWDLCLQGATSVQWRKGQSLQ